MYEEETHLAVVDEDVEEGVQEEDPVREDAAGVKQHWLQGRQRQHHTTLLHKCTSVQGNL